MVQQLTLWDHFNGGKFGWVHKHLLVASAILPQDFSVVGIFGDDWLYVKYANPDMAIQAVFRSWNSPRAVKYRDINNISSDFGTAVTVQSMVYGNLNAQSGSGVAFTRNPTTGAKELYGEYLPNAEVSPNWVASLTGST